MSKKLTLDLSVVARTILLTKIKLNPFQFGSHVSTMYTDLYSIYSLIYRVFVKEGREK